MLDQRSFRYLEVAKASGGSGKLPLWSFITPAKDDDVLPITQAAKLG
jgi:hypothetical protein